MCKRCTFGVHDVYLRSTFCEHVVYEWCKCGEQVMYVHAMNVWCTFGVHVVYIRCT